MTYAEMKTLLDTTGIPFVYMAWKKGGAPNLPYGVFLFPGSNNFGADGIVYHTANQCRIELYTKYKSPELEKSIEDVLTGAGIYFERDETYIDEEEMLLNAYECEV